MKNKYYKKLDVLRIISCIGVFLYHLNILKGGYLFVCTFFVLSGYLSCLSAFKKEKFSFFDYYKGRLKHIYIPLVVVFFLTVLVMSYMPNLNYVGLKPEGISILLGYNNFWQIKANSDYFARHINSPFMHLWYIAILMQFEAIFPILFIILKKIGNKIKKIIPCIITIVLSAIGIIYFYKASLSLEITKVYYDTFSRCFSILLGISLGLIYSYYKKLIPKKNENISKVLFYLILTALIVLSIIDSSSSKYYSIYMIAATFISIELIRYSSVTIKEKENKFIKFVASFTYEIYLIQYPVIYFFQNLNLNYYLKISLIFIITTILAIIIHFGLNLKEKKKKVLRYIVFSIIILLTLFGGYKFITTKDNTKEMKELELLLNKNEEVMKKKQEEYEAKLKNENENFEATLKEIENNENGLKDYVKNLPIIGVGDSVMLGAIDNLYSMFPNSYFNAKISRTDYEANDILVGLKYNNLLGNPVIFNLGTNGQCGETCRISILNTLEDREIFWITVTNDYDVHVNNDLKAFADRHDNVHIIDWESLSKGHYEYFIADGIHLTPIGREAYVNIIYDSIYNFYLEKYNSEKEKVLMEHELIKKKKISFYGNDLLLNAFDDLQAIYTDSSYNINNDYDFNSLFNKISEDISSSNINYNVVIALDNSVKLNKNDYSKLVNLCKDNNLYIIKVNNINLEFDNENVKIIDFYNEISSNSNYLLSDKIHLSKYGNEKLIELLQKEIVIENS